MFSSFNVNSQEASEENVGVDEVEQGVKGIEIENMRRELLLLSSDGEVKKSQAYINKAPAKIIEKLYAEYEAKQQEKNLEMLCDLFISKLAMMLGGLDAIERPEEMEKELMRNPLLRKDLKSAACWLTPLVPFLGVITGGLTVGKHVWEKKAKEEEEGDH